MAKTVLNWRYAALLAVFAASLLALIAESESIILWVASTAAALAGFTLFGSLLGRWGRGGKIDRLAGLAEEE